MKLAGKLARNRWVNLGWVVLTVVVIMVVRAYTQRGIVQGEAPPLEGVTLAGEWTSLVELRGTPVLVHFWATWCPVCRREQGTIESIAQEYPVVTIAMQSGRVAEVRAYVRENALNAPVLVDEFGDIARVYGVRAVPTSFILDRHGMIRFVEVGYTTEAGLRARLWLAGL